MSIWSNVKGRKAPGYKDEVLRDYSHYKDPLDTTEGRLSGISRKCGDVSAETSDLVKTLLVNEWKAAGLSDDLISVGLAIVSVESGFNPDAASNESAAGFGQFVTRDIVQNNQTYASRWTQLVNRYNAEHPNDQISNDPSHYDDGKGSFFDVTAQAKVMAYQINDLYGKMAEFVINANGKSPDANNYSRELIMYAVHHQGINASWDNVQRFLENPRNLELFSWLETNFSISTIIFTTNADDTGILPSDKIAEIGKLQNSPWLSFLIRNGFDNQLLQCHQSFTTATTAQSPLILDLDGDGVETTLATDGAYFDHDGNGFAEQTGWASSDDGALVWDRNNDGRINDGKELFGNETLLQNGSKATNGFQALAEWDENTDGKIDSNDSIWSNLKVWGRTMMEMVIPQQMNF